MNKVTLTGYITISEAELGFVREALPQHIVATRNESGCIVFEVQERPTGQGVFDVYEEFESEFAFKNHQKRAGKSHWGMITKNAQRNYTIEGLKP